MLKDFALLLAGGVLLYLGAEWLVRGASGLAAKLRIRPIVIGLTVVAYGTSAPELVVGIGAALAGRGGIAFGNAIGSNIANLGLILGVTALTSPPRVDGSLRRRELPILVFSALSVPVLLIDGRISRLEGAGLVLAALSYTAWMLRASRAAGISTEAVVETTKEVEAAAAEAAGPPPLERSTKELIGLALLGLLLLLLGGKWLVDGASQIALSFGVPERLVGLTIVAIGTSVPELATSLVAARRGHADLAVGNVIGSNIFNILLILGASGLAGPFEVSLREARIDLVALVLMTLGASFLLRRERFVSRVEGAFLLVAYVIFLCVVAIAPR